MYHNSVILLSFKYSCFRRFYLVIRETICPFFKTIWQIASKKHDNFKRLDLRGIRRPKIEWWVFLLWFLFCFKENLITKDQRSRPYQPRAPGAAAADLILFSFRKRKGSGSLIRFNKKLKLKGRRPKGAQNK